MSSTDARRMSGLPLVSVRSSMTSQARMMSLEEGKSGAWARLVSARRDSKIGRRSRGASGARLAALGCAEVGGFRSATSGDTASAI